MGTSIYHGVDIHCSSRYHRTSAKTRLVTEIVQRFNLQRMLHSLLSPHRILPSHAQPRSIIYQSFKDTASQQQSPDREALEIYLHTIRVKSTRLTALQGNIPVMVANCSMHALSRTGASKALGFFKHLASHALRDSSTSAFASESCADVLGCL